MPAKPRLAELVSGLGRVQKVGNQSPISVLESATVRPKVHGEPVSTNLGAGKLEPPRKGREAFYMSIRKRMVLPVAFAAAALAMMVVASMASATHVRPQGATPLRVPLVPNYTACTGAVGLTHGPPLAFPSCPAGCDLDGRHARYAGQQRRRGAIERLRVALSGRWCPGSARGLRRGHHVEHHGRALYARLRSHAVPQTPSDQRTMSAICRAMPRSGSRTTGTPSRREADRTAATVFDIPYPIACDMSCRGNGCGDRQHMLRDHLG